MNTERDRHDYSLLGSFMPQEGPDPRASIPINVSIDEEAPASDAEPPTKPLEPGSVKA